MPEQIISPKRSWREKVWGEIKAFSPQVKASLIGLGGTLTVTALVTIVGWLNSSSENSSLKSKVHDLEMEVLPFRNLAVQQFNKADAESLKRLADTMTTLHRDYSMQIETINALRSQIDQLRKANEDAERTLFSKMTNETFSLKDLDHVLVIPSPNGPPSYMVRLSQPPIAGSAEIYAKSADSVETRLQPGFGKAPCQNITVHRLWDFDTNTVSFSCRYVIDTHETNFAHRMPKLNEEFIMQADGVWSVKHGLTNL